jgi:hypothetical protein
MLTGPSLKTAWSLAAAGLLTLAGCAQPGPILSRHTTIGTLKTSLSHLEFENQQLRSKVANLESENREFENRLVQEEAANGELHAQLDDARNLLSRQGYDWGGSNATTNREEPPNRTLPAGRSNRTPRKPPFARIPGRIDAAPPADPSDDEFNRPAVPSANSLGPQSSLEDDTRWLPIARGTGASGPSTKVRQ